MKSPIINSKVNQSFADEGGYDLELSMRRLGGCPERGSDIGRIVS